MVKAVSSYIERRHRKLSRKLSVGGGVDIGSAYEHLEQSLEALEMKAAEALRTARTVEDLHNLRLDVKSWRYLLEEFFGVSCTGLYKAQQLLGRLNDVDRLRLFLLECSGPGINESIELLLIRREELLSEWSTVKDSLPFGFRPENVSRSRRI